MNMNAAPNALPAEATMTRGLAGVTAGRTAISSLAGELRYRGYSIESLAQASDFEDVAYLLLHGELATKKEHDAFVGRIRDSATSLDKTLVQSLTLLAQRQSSASPMDALRSGISILGQIQLDQTPGIHALLIAQAERLLGETPSILAAWMDASSNRPIAPWPNAPLADSLLERLTGRQPSQSHIQAFGTTLVLYAEHEFNASTFAARTVVSTGSDMHSGVTAAIGALKGPLHGGANEQVLEQLSEIGSVDRAEAWVSEQLSAKRVIMGFGHRVYKDGDPRAVLLGRMCRSLVQGTDGERLEDLADTIEQLMLQRKGLRPNLDWPAARIYHALGLPIRVFTPIFVVARMSGWTAHIIEQIGDNRLIRPMSLYCGESPRDFVSLETRSASGASCF
ncbi:MAG: citrate synthase [Planctomycetota bacterium]|nr:MAG: citrate synthase [Planctomycetota bacterium]